MRIAVGRVISSLLCLLGLPIHLLLMVLIMVCDPGSGLYRSNRLGKHGVPFTLLKYRTMKVNAPSILTTQFKTVVAESDPRVTKLGKWLRSGIDELPQFWNIVRGEMEWVGPRPDLAWMLPNYGPVIKRRLECVPGITGLAQVLNSRDLSTAESYAIDIWYLEHRGFWLDVWIVFMTPLFMTGWVSIGEEILQKLRSSPEFNRLHEACTAELSAAALASPASSKTLSEHITK